MQIGDLLWPADWSTAVFAEPMGQRIPSVHLMIGFRSLRSQGWNLDSAY